MVLIVPTQSPPLDGSFQRKSQLSGAVDVKTRSILLGSIVRLLSDGPSKVRPIPFACWTVRIEPPLRLIWLLTASPPCRVCAVPWPTSRVLTVTSPRLVRLTAELPL